MFLRAHSILLALAGVAVASLNLLVQDTVKSQIPVLPTQAEVIIKHLGRSSIFHADSL